MNITSLKSIDEIHSFLYPPINAKKTEISVKIGWSGRKYIYGELEFSLNDLVKRLQDASKNVIRNPSIDEKVQEIISKIKVLDRKGNTVYDRENYFLFKLATFFARLFGNIGFNRHKILLKIKDQFDVNFHKYPEIVEDVDNEETDLEEVAVKQNISLLPQEKSLQKPQIKEAKSQENLKQISPEPHLKKFISSNDLKKSNSSEKLKEAEPPKPLTEEEQKKANETGKKLNETIQTAEVETLDVSLLKARPAPKNRKKPTLTRAQGEKIHNQLNQTPSVKEETSLPENIETKTTPSKLTKKPSMLDELKQKQQSVSPLSTPKKRKAEIQEFVEIQAEEDSDLLVDFNKLPPKQEAIPQLVLKQEVIEKEAEVLPSISKKVDVIVLPENQEVAPKEKQVIEPPKVEVLEKIIQKEPKEPQLKEKTAELIEKAIQNPQPEKTQKVEKQLETPQEQVKPVQEQVKPIEVISEPEKKLKVPESLNVPVNEQAKILEPKKEIAIKLAEEKPSVPVSQKELSKLPTSPSSKPTSIPEKRSSVISPDPKKNTPKQSPNSTLNKQPVERQATPPLSRIKIDKQGGNTARSKSSGNLNEKKAKEGVKKPVVSPLSDKVPELPQGPAPALPPEPVGGLVNINPKPPAKKASGKLDASLKNNVESMITGKKKEVKGKNNSKEQEVSVSSKEEEVSVSSKEAEVYKLVDLSNYKPPIAKQKKVKDPTKKIKKGDDSKYDTIKRIKVTTVSAESVEKLKNDLKS